MSSMWSGAIRRLFKTGKPASHDTSQYWERRYRQGGTSGSGSYGRLAEFKASFLNEFVARNRVNSVLELGCGDGNQLSLAHYPRYTGVDLSQAALEICRRKFAHDATKEFFLEVPPDKRTEGYDLTISLDVIFHLVEDALFERYMETLFRAARNWVIIYSSNETDEKVQQRFPEHAAPHVRHRRFKDWVDQFESAWVLDEVVETPYRFDPGNPNETSFSDFYIFRRRTE